LLCEGKFSDIDVSFELCKNVVWNTMKARNIFEIFYDKQRPCLFMSPQGAFSTWQTSWTAPVKRKTNVVVIFPILTCYMHFSFIKFAFSLTKQVLDAHSSMLTTIFYMITPIVCPEPLLKVFFGNIYCLHVTLTTRGTKLGCVKITCCGNPWFVLRGWHTRVKLSK
jgi:hypothetical protein